MTLTHPALDAFTPARPDEPLTGRDIGSALSTLAGIFFSADTLMPELLLRDHPKQAVTVSVGMDSASHVEMVAARLGAEVTRGEIDGRECVSFEYGLLHRGPNYGITSFEFAVVVRCAYIADEESR